MMHRRLGLVVLALLFGLGLWMRAPLTALAAAPSNDAFTSHLVISNLPFSTSVEIGAASVEVDEPSSTCTNPGDITDSVWYAFTPTTSELLTANFSGYPSILAVYTGSSLNDLTQVDCRTYWQTQTLSFAATAGTTYYFQVGSLYGFGGFATFSLDVAGPPVAQINYYSPGIPSPLDMLQFYGYAYDPAGMGLTSLEWDFGDGTTTTGDWAYHQYTADGEYVVTLTVTTADGRQAVATRIVRVESHDVSITRFTTPNSARSGQTSKIVVGLNSRVYSNTVTADLYRSTPGGYQLIGSLQQYIPNGNKNSSTDLLFSYTFTPEDAAIGKVTFRAVVNLQGMTDVFIGDNEAISLPTKVSGGKVSAAGVEEESTMQEGFVLRSQADDNPEMRDLFLLPTRWVYLPTINNR